MEHSPDTRVRTPIVTGGSKTTPLITLQMVYPVRLLSGNTFKLEFGIRKEPTKHSIV